MSHALPSLPTRERLRVLCDCGAAPVVELVAVIDLPGDPQVFERLADGVLNVVGCTECGARLNVEAPVAVVDWDAQALFVVLGEGQRHLGLRARAELLERLADTGEGVALPAFLSEPVVVFGGAGVEEARRRVERQRAARAEAEAATIQAEAVRSDALESIQRRTTELDARERSLDERAQEIRARTDELRALQSDIEARGRRVIETSRDVEAKERAVDEARRDLEARAAEEAALVAAAAAAEGGGDAPDAPGPEAAGGGDDGLEDRDADEEIEGTPARAERWDRSVDDEWSLGGGPPADGPRDTVPNPAVVGAGGGATLGRAAAPHGSDHAPTVRFRHDELRADSPDVEILAPAPAAGPFAAFDTAAAAGGDRYTAVHSGVVHLCLRADADALRGLLGRRLDLRFQLHRPAEGPVAALVLVAVDEAAERAAAVWTLDPRSGAGREILDILARAFRLQVVLFDATGAPHRLLPFERPLEENVRLGLVGIGAVSGATDYAAARAAVLSGAWDLLGEKAHPFHGGALAPAADAARARFVVNVLEYWNEPRNREYLLLTKSLPAAEFQATVRAGIEAALQFGIALGDGLTERALALGLAPGRRGLVQTALASFAEVALRLKPGGLDEVAECENWEALFEQAEECAVAVDPSILRLAEGAMERVRAIVEQGDRPRPAPTPPGGLRAATPPPPPPAHAADPGLPPSPDRATNPTMEIDPDEDVGLFLDDGADEQRPADGLAALPVRDLVALLDDDARAQAAMVAVGARGDRRTADALVARVTGDAGPGRTRALECLAGMDEMAVVAVVEGVKARKRSDEALDDAVAVLVRAVGKEQVERLRRDRSRKVRDAAGRVLKRLSDGQTDPRIREQEAVANALLGGGHKPRREDATP